MVNWADIPPHRMGDLCEARFQMEAMRRGWMIAKPFGHAQHFDFVIKRHDLPWESVQVKSAVRWKVRETETAAPLAINLRRRTSSGTRSLYRSGDFDLFAAVHLPSDRIWLIPFACTKGNRANFPLRGAYGFLLGDGEPDLSNILALTAGYRTATEARASRHISDADVDGIFEARSNGATYDAIGKKFNLAPSHARRICTGEVEYAAKRHPLLSGRRISRTTDEIDGNGRVVGEDVAGSGVGAVGVMYWRP